MTETKPRQRASISEALVLAHLAQAEQMSEFFIEMWLQNPAMARQAGARVHAMLSLLGAVPDSVCRGFRFARGQAPTFCRGP